MLKLTFTVHKVNYSDLYNHLLWWGNAHFSHSEFEIDPIPEYSQYITITTKIENTPSADKLSDELSDSLKDFFGNGIQINKIIVPA